ncbi:MAG TPA: DUF6174 domain-containing protein [Longimicrobium sp.]|nr:DUF6174 domain-containing protein [Longimicrobium sp.]
MIRLIRSLAPALLLAACAAPLVGGGDEDSLSRRRWEGQGIDDYRYVYDAVCFCAERGPVQVTVRDGRVVEVANADPNARVAGGATRQVLTVDELFDRIEEAEANGTYTKVEYHPRLGYPTSAEIGTLANDAGTLYRITDLVPLN